MKRTPSTWRRRRSRIGRDKGIGTRARAGVAILKWIYKIFKDKGSRLRLLSAAFREHMRWSEFRGGDVVMSPPYKWQLRCNASDVEAANCIDDRVDPKIVAELSKKSTTEHLHRNARSQTPKLALREQRT